MEFGISIQEYITQETAKEKKKFQKAEPRRGILSNPCFCLNLVWVKPFPEPSIQNDGWGLDSLRQPCPLC